MKQLFMQFIKEEDGATMVEYAILVALISVVLPTQKLCPPKGGQRR